MKHAQLLELFAAAVVTIAWLLVMAEVGAALSLPVLA